MGTVLGSIFMTVSHTCKLPFMYWNQQAADYYAGHCTFNFNDTVLWSYLLYIAICFPIKIPIRFISLLHTLILNTNVGLVIHYRSRLCFYYQQHPFRDFSLFPWPHLLPSMVMTNSVFLYDLFNSLYKISSTIQLSEATSKM